MMRTGDRVVVSYNSHDYYRCRGTIIDIYHNAGLSYPVIYYKVLLDSGGYHYIKSSHLERIDFYIDSDIIFNSKSKIDNKLNNKTVLLTDNKFLKVNQNG